MTSGTIVHTDDDGYLRTVGERVRASRGRRGMTRRALAELSGVSERYVAQLEAGRGNASVLILRALARALGEPLAALIEEPAFVARAGRAARIALIGLRGAGKSALGSRLAAARGVPFIELDREIERASGVALGGIFDIYGQTGYRRLERAALAEVLERYPAFVLATGGSIVSAADTFSTLLSACRTVWLRATPAEHMARVVAQGDERPMAGNREAMADLRRILAGREPLYRRADIAVDTSGASLDDAFERLHAALQA